MLYVIKKILFSRSSTVAFGILMLKHYDDTEIICFITAE